MCVYEKNYASQDEDTTYEKVQQLPYLDLVLKEGNSSNSMWLYYRCNRHRNSDPDFYMI